MGWGSANDIVDPQIEAMVKAVAREDMPESLAEELLVSLIEKCQAGDWDTEDESLERFVHVPWVVRAFARCGIKQRVQRMEDLERVIRQVIDANADSWYDLSEDFARDLYAEKIAAAVWPLMTEA